MRAVADYSYRRNAYLSSLVLDYSDIQTLVAVRSTCRANYLHVAAAYQRTLRRILSVFVPRSSELLRIVTDCCGVIGGEAALAFCLRDPSFLPGALHIYTADGWFEPLIELLSNSSFYATHLESLGAITVPQPLARLRGIRHQAILRTATGKFIYLFESTTVSSCTPISRAWTTALMNFVTAHSFGCAHPRLLQGRRALYSDLAVHTFPHCESATLQRLITAGFSFGIDPTAWPEFQGLRSRPPPHRDVVRPCVRGHFLCPDQGRFFGDRGSLVGLLDSLEVGYESLRWDDIPPFGHMPVWRMLGSFQCTEDCASRDPVLPGGIVSITMLAPHDAAPFQRAALEERGGPSVLRSPRNHAFQTRPRARTV